MFNYILPYAAATLTQVCWLFLDGIDVHHIDVMDVMTITCVVLPHTAAVFFGNKTTSTPHHTTDSCIPAPTQPQQHDTHVRAYRQHVVATMQVVQQSYIEHKTILCAGLKIMVLKVKITPCPVLQASMTTMMAPYIIKLPMACLNKKTTTTSMISHTKSMVCTTRPATIKLTPVVFKPRKPHMVTCETT